MLVQQLRQMERDTIVRRIVHHHVPPKAEYGLTSWGKDSVRRLMRTEMGGSA
jgi:DNA-binding HxlR family transcriptional regulator